jgi:L-seryl-tRNA(Ser) seleniumtransferase
MAKPPAPLSRRQFVGAAGLLPVAALEAGRLDSQNGAPVGVYARLGVRPFINAAGTYTALSASTMPAEVMAAMEEASRAYVSIPELQQTAGARIASLLGAEAALVTSGCAAALTLGTAACVAGADAGAIRRLPDTAGLRNEVIFQKSHRFVYDHAVRAAGAKIVEVETADELRAAVGPQTAMAFFLNAANGQGRIPREEFAALARKAGVPSLIDAAADVPPASNLTAFTRMGYDLVAFSGGKGLRGPQCSGLLLGRKALVDAAFLHGAPHADSIGRAAKVGKEEIVGLLTALELYLKRDHDADWREWDARVARIAAAVAGVPGVKAERFVPEIANEVPHLAITWDEDGPRVTRAAIVEALRRGEPRIEVRPGDPNARRLEIAVWMMAPGDAETVARRCREAFEGAASQG